MRIIVSKDLLTSVSFGELVNKMSTEGSVYPQLTTPLTSVPDEELPIYSDPPLSVTQLRQEIAQQEESDEKKEIELENAIIKENVEQLNSLIGKNLYEGFDTIVSKFEELDNYLRESLGKTNIIYEFQGKKWTLNDLKQKILQLSKSQDLENYIKLIKSYAENAEKLIINYQPSSVVPLDSTPKKTKPKKKVTEEGARIKGKTNPNKEKAFLDAMLEAKTELNEEFGSKNFRVKDLIDTDSMQRYALQNNVKENMIRHRFHNLLKEGNILKKEDIKSYWKYSFIEDDDSEVLDIDEVSVGEGDVSEDTQAHQSEAPLHAESQAVVDDKKASVHSKVSDIVRDTPDLPPDSQQPVVQGPQNEHPPVAHGSVTQHSGSEAQTLNESDQFQDIQVAPPGHEVQPAELYQPAFIAAPQQLLARKLHGFQQYEAAASPRTRQIFLEKREDKHFHWNDFLGMVEPKYMFVKERDNLNRVEPDNSRAANFIPRHILSAHPTRKPPPSVLDKERKILPFGKAHGKDARIGEYIDLKIAPKTLYIHIKRGVQDMALEILAERIIEHSKQGETRIMRKHNRKGKFSYKIWVSTKEMKTLDKHGLLEKLLNLTKERTRSVTILVRQKIIRSSIHDIVDTSFSLL